MKYRDNAVRSKNCIRW